MKRYQFLDYIQKLLTGFGDLIFPPETEEKLLRTVTDSTLELVYEPAVFQDTFYLCCYAEPIVRAAVTENKFHNNRLAARHLGQLLKKWVVDQTQPTLYIPIPLGRKRLRQRGHNQVETIVKNVTQTTCPTANLLRRHVETLPQSQLTKLSRRQNVRDVFEYVGGNYNLANYSQLIIVDDVVTTGATLEAARATLAPHLPTHITLHCLAIAH